MSDTDYGAKLARLLASLPPLPGEEIGLAENGRVPEDGFIGPTQPGAALSPRQWLGWHGIPILEKSATCADLLHGRAKAVFIHRASYGEHLEARVVIPTGSDINSPQVSWCVWHEIGHAMDYVAKREGKLIATSHGHFSTKHCSVLRMHQEVIISWHPHSDRTYKTLLAELWAEVVACAVNKPAECPDELLREVVPDLRSRGIPLPHLKGENHETPNDQGRGDGGAASAHACCC